MRVAKRMPRKVLEEPQLPLIKMQPRLTSEAAGANGALAVISEHRRSVRDDGILASHSVQCAQQPGRPRVRQPARKRPQVECMHALTLTSPQRPPPPI